LFDKKYRYVTLTFNRPGLNAMLDDVKVGLVGTVIIKDQSRIGRDVLEVGLLKRTFEEYNVRYIAANDNLDSANGFDIMSIFRDVFNEWYVADCSKKIRSVKRSNALAGKCNCRSPYGYRSVNSSIWEVDENAAVYVREIFMRVVSGDSFFTIAKDFCKRGIEPPLVYSRRLKGLPPLNEDAAWTTHLISIMCSNQAYIGKLVSQKTTTPSYKNKKIIERPEEEWVIIENHHPPIVSLEIFELVQKLRANRRRYPKKEKLVGILSGLLRCADCNYVLRMQNDPDGKYQYYICSNYSNKKSRFISACSRHSIRRDIVEAITLSKIQETVKFARENKDLFAKQLKEMTQKESANAIKLKTSELTKVECRINEMDNIVKRLYEDNVNGKLTDALFIKFSKDYETEHSSLTLKISTLKTEIDELQNKMVNLQQFMNLVDNYGNRIDR